MEIRNKQQNLGFGALLIRQGVSDPKNKESNEAQINKIKHTLDGASIAVEALTGKEPNFQQTRCGQKAAYIFEATEELEQKLKFYLNSRHVLDTYVVKDKDSITNEWKESQKFVWG